ncbi:transposase [Dehalobacter sp. 14DCB1]|uniref:transposase n=1 Tax=Dehalobacter sp. 14DCB1 TaxID=2070227 RepID=UPI0010527581|nr:transposase [Dehalobacter sp. 14DCB1]TCX53845.1 hypothetical protein C1I36_03685 [Dehalobacter sp. 14DCB1]
MLSQYSSDFKLEIIRKIETENISIPKAAIRFGVNKNTLQSWMKKYRKSSALIFPESNTIENIDKQLIRLKKENEMLKAENDLLKRTAIYFARCANMN